MIRTAPRTDLSLSAFALAALMVAGLAAGFVAGQAAPDVLGALTGASAAGAIEAPALTQNAYAILAFGGAAGLHVTEIARQLELRRVAVPRLAAVLSAWGMLASDLRYELARTHIGDTTRIDPAELRASFAELEAEGRRRLTAAAFDGRVRVHRSVDMRYGEQVFEFAHWDLRTGLRYDRDGFSDESLVSPRLTANWRPVPGMRVSATAGVFYQSPRFLVRAASPENFGIENERITHLSVGVERSFAPGWTLLVEPYYQWLDNLVVEQERTSGRVTNNGEGTNRGLDVVLSRRFADGWFGNVVYAYNSARINENDGFGDYDADFNREHFFSIGGSWEISQRWKLGARWKYVTGRPTDAFVINDDVLGAGQPFRYSLTGQTAVIDVPAPAGRGPASGWRFELTLAR